MSKIAIAVLCAILPLGVLEAAPAASAPTTPTTAAKTTLVDRIGLIVNQDVLTQGEIEEAVISYFYAQGKEPPAASKKVEWQEARKTVLEGMIEELVLSQQAAAMTLEVSDKKARKQAETEVEAMKKRFASPAEFEKELAKEGLTEKQFIDSQTDRMKRRMQVAQVVRAKQAEMPASLVTGADEIRKAYEGNEREYDQIRFSAIVFRIPEDRRRGAEYKAALVQQAKEMVQELKGGADFATYAKKYSEDPTTAGKGGDAGTRYRHELPADLARALFALPVKGVGTLATDEVVYVLKVDSKTVSTLESASAEIRDRLSRQSTDEAMRKWIDQLKATAYVKIID